VKIIETSKSYYSCTDNRQPYVTLSLYFMRFSMYVYRLYAMLYTAHGMLCASPAYKYEHEAQSASTVVPSCQILDAN